MGGIFKLIIRALKIAQLMFQAGRKSRDIFMF